MRDRGRRRRCFASEEAGEEGVRRSKVGWEEEAGARSRRRTPDLSPEIACGGKKKVGVRFSEKCSER